MEEFKPDYKPDEEMRICKTPNCGQILEGKQIWCRGCIQKRKLDQLRTANKKISNLPKNYPTYKCPDCGAVIQLDFYPCTNSYNMIRFDNIKKEHKCQS